MATDPAEQRFYHRVQDERGGPIARRYARTLLFSSRGSEAEVTGGQRFMPLFNGDGVLNCVVQDADNGAVLFCETMNREALSLTLRSGIAHFWAVNDRRPWHLCKPAGFQLHVVTMLVDQEQKSLLLQVRGTGPVPAQFARRVDLLSPPRDLAINLKLNAAAGAVNFQTVTGAHV